MTDDRENRICIVAIMKDEILSVLEWIAYYKSIGADEIILYDNGSTDGTEVIGRSLADRGEITCIEWPEVEGRKPQTSAYADALTRTSCEWVGFFDLDEFLVLDDGARLPEFLAGFSNDVGAIGINWRLFGSNGQKSYEARPVLERFTSASAEDHQFNNHIKTIVQRKTATRPLIHTCSVREGRYVHADGTDISFISEGRTEKVVQKTARLHHYATKSDQEWRVKIDRGHANRPDRGVRRKRVLLRNFEILDSNEIEDRSALEYRDGMLAEADRLMALLRLDGMDYPCWPFQTQ